MYRLSSIVLLLMYSALFVLLVCLYLLIVRRISIPRLWPIAVGICILLSLSACSDDQRPARVQYRCGNILQNLTQVWFCLFLWPYIWTAVDRSHPRYGPCYIPFDDGWLPFGIYHRPYGAVWYKRTTMSMVCPPPFFLPCCKWLWYNRSDDHF